ncbi:hypothetical protein HPB47_024791 [Ixodes persulcatus]|uniref:Uncharacterized protein n=1 Tax=Ixodes persulcatus TaxID=34615 RepID=A0AC60Q3D3_IXOPE|nr:hypothetical protein HPB47_024791 [Ixodes persulcatus]
MLRVAVLPHLQRQLKSTSSEGSRSDESEVEPAPHVVTRGQSRREAVVPSVPSVPQTPPREASTEAHPFCLGLSDEAAKVVTTYDWKCHRCRLCERCAKPEAPSVSDRSCRPNVG